MSPSKPEIKELILRLAEERGPESSICPSEAAKALNRDDWRKWMPPVHEQAAVLSEEGRIMLTQKGEIKPAEEIKGPYRIKINYE